MKRIVLSGLLLAVLALFAGSFVSSTQTEDAQLAAAAESVGMEKPIPPDALETAIRSGRAMANAQGVTLLLPGGKPLTFQDRKTGCPDAERQLDDANCQHFVLAADLPGRHFFLIRRQDYEGGTWFLVDDRSGQRTEIDAAPVFSPDGRRFFVQNDNEATDHDNNLEIWQRQGYGAAIEWAHPWGQVYVEAPMLKEIYHAQVTSWNGDQIALAFSTHEWSDMPALHWTGRLTRQSDGWNLNANWPKKN
jgi:hypothetical protein